MLHATFVNGLMVAVRLVASYRALSLDADALGLGIVAAGFAVLSVVAAVPMGRLVDRFGEPIFLALAGLLLGLGSALTVTADSIALLTVSQSLLGLGQLAAVVASQTLVGRRGDRTTRSARFGVYAAGAAIGQLVGPLVGAAVVAAAVAGSGAAPGSGHLLRHRGRDDGARHLADPRGGPPRAAPSRGRPDRGEGARDDHPALAGHGPDDGREPVHQPGRGHAGRVPAGVR